MELPVALWYYNLIISMKFVEYEQLLETVNCEQSEILYYLRNVLFSFLRWAFLSCTYWYVLFKYFSHCFEIILLYIQKVWTQALATYEVLTLDINQLIHMIDMKWILNYLVDNSSKFMWHTYIVLNSTLYLDEYNGCNNKKESEINIIYLY